jgi:hypothetical protein
MPESSLSRERRGDASNRVYRVALLFDGLAAGGDSEGIDLILAHLTAVRDELVDGCETWPEAAIAEQEADGAEDVAEARALVDPDALPLYVQHGERHIAAARRAVAAARREWARRCERQAA